MNIYAVKVISSCVPSPNSVIDAITGALDSWFKDVAGWPGKGAPGGCPPPSLPVPVAPFPVFSIATAHVPVQPTGMGPSGKI